MGHHYKKKNHNTSISEVDLNSQSQTLNNITPSDLSKVMKNIDINKIISMMSNAFLPLYNAEENKSSNSEDIISQHPSLSSDITEQTQYSPLSPCDPSIVILNSLKPFLPEDKCRIIDGMLHALGIKSVIDTFLSGSKASN